MSVIVERKDGSQDEYANYECHDLNDCLGSTYLEWSDMYERNDVYCNDCGTYIGLSQCIGC